MADAKRIDWDDEGTWPFAQREHTFICKALAIVGRYKYGAEWIGDEFWSGYQGHALGPIQAGTISKARDAHAILKHYRPEAAPLKATELTDAQWREVQLLYPEYEKKRENAWERKRGAKQALRDLCAHEELVASFRWENSGEYEPIPAGLWRLEKFWDWLSFGDAPLNDVFDRSYSTIGRERIYLFVESDGLDKLELETAAFVENVRAESSEYLSPYIRLMITVSRELGISREHQPNKSQVEAKVRQVSKRGGMPEMKKTAVEYAATFIREPESQSGAASRLRRKPA